MEFHKILNSRIPDIGRNLTSAECKALRKEGVSCSENWFIEQLGPGCDIRGRLWYPFDGGMNNARVYVELKSF